MPIDERIFDGKFRCSTHSASVQRRQNVRDPVLPAKIKSVWRPFLSCFLASAVMLPTMAISATQDDEPAVELTAKASSILAQSTALAEIWPGYWPEDQGFILYDPAHGAVFVGANGQPRNVDYRAGVLPGADTTFVFDYPAGTPNMMLITVGEDWLETLTTLFHEQFHNFQTDAFDHADRRHANEYVDLTAIPNRATFTAAAELERRVLADALLAETDAQRTDLSRRYLALRRAREATVGDAIIAKERYLERSEGTAQYVGLMAKSVVVGENAGTVAESLAEGLRRDLLANAEGSYSGNWFRWRAYDVGGAIAMLLARSDSDWTRRSEAGEPLDVIFEDSLGEMDKAAQDRLAVATRDDYGAEQLLIDVTADLATLPKTIESTADFMALGKRRVAVELTIPRDRLSDGRQFSSTRKMIAVGPSATAFLEVDSFQMERSGITLALEGLSVLTERLPLQSGEPVTMRYTIVLDDNFTLPTLDELPPGDYAMDRVNIAVTGLTINIDRPVMVTVTEDQITITTSVASD